MSRVDAYPHAPGSNDPPESAINSSITNARSMNFPVRGDVVVGLRTFLHMSVVCNLKACSGKRPALGYRSARSVALWHSYRSVTRLDGARFTRRRKVSLRRKHRHRPIQMTTRDNGVCP